MRGHGAGSARAGSSGSWPMDMMGYHSVTVAIPSSVGAQLPEIGWPSAVHVPTFPLPDQP